MDDFRRDISTLIVSWIFWAILVWLVFAFISQQTITEWTTGTRWLYLLFVGVGIIPSIGMAAWVEGAANADEKKRRIANGEIDEENTHQDPNAYDPNIG